MEGQNIYLNPVQLVYLAKRVNGSYIDYEYIAAMQDIGERHSIRIHECMDDLEQKGYLTENFDGSVEVRDDIGKLIKVITDGYKESEFIVRDHDQIKAHYKFHHGQECSVQVIPDGSNLQISVVSDEDIRKTFLSFVGDEESLSTDGSEADITQADEIYTVKAIIPAIRSVTDVYFRKDGAFYEPASGSSSEPVLFSKITLNEFSSKAFAILEGGRNGVQR